MGFFGTQIKLLTFADVNDLVGTAQENVRLEFKSGPVGRDEYLKKFSSFANTSGGYLILGMAEGANNIAREVTGVAEQPSFEAQVTSWCAQHLYPPLVPHVSNPIQVPSTGTFCYVVYVEESDLAPHFIEGRQGCYIRTNESSHRFDAQLATMAEIQALLNRRQQARETAKAVRARSEERRDQREARLEPVRGKSDYFLPLTISVGPRYPRKELLELKELTTLAGGASIMVGGHQFPYLDRGVYSRMDSLLATLAGARSDKGFLEITRYGTVAYTQFFQSVPIDAGRDDLEENRHLQFWISMPWLLGAILLGLKYAKNFCRAARIHSTLDIRVELRSKFNTGYYMFGNHGEGYAGASLTSNERIEIAREEHPELFVTSWPDRGVDIWRELYYSLGLLSAYAPDTDRIVERAKQQAVSWIGGGDDFLTQ